MGKIKKIVCILTCAVCVLCTLGTCLYAEAIPLTFKAGNIDYVNTQTNATGDFLTYKSFSTGYSIASLPSALYSTIIGNTDVYFLFTFNEGQTEGISTFAFAPLYTYSIHFQGIIQGRQAPKGNYPLPQYHDPFSDNETLFLWSARMADSAFLSPSTRVNNAQTFNNLISLKFPYSADPLGNESYVTYIDEVFRDYVVAPCDNVPGTVPGNNYYNSYSIDFYYIFHTTEDIPINLVSFVSHINFSFNMENVDPNVQITWSPISIEATYDPEGTWADEEIDETEKIIQGQKEAAEYALDLEEQANQEAYDEAVEGMSDAQNAFNLNFVQQTGIQSLLSAINYSGTDFSFKFPQLNVPFFDQPLSQEQEIPLKYYIDQIPPVVIYGLRVLGWIGLTFSVIHFIKKIVGIIAGYHD